MNYQEQSIPKLRPTFIFINRISLNGFLLTILGFYQKNI